MTQDYMEFQVSLSNAEEEALYDPQTSGGLLLSVPDLQAEDLLKALSEAGMTSAVRLGEISEGPPGILVV